MTDTIDQYNAWRISFQDAERAAQSAYAEMLRYKAASLIGREDMIRALIEAKDIAMKNVFAARIPECGDFGAIAQDLAYICQELSLEEYERKMRAEALDELTRIAQENGEYDD